MECDCTTERAQPGQGRGARGRQHHWQRRYEVVRQKSPVAAGDVEEAAWILDW